MKRLFLLVLVLLTFSIMFAQTQQGIVKTRGRMVNGQLVAGKRLSGATITLNMGNPLVSGNQGVFSFVVPASKSYSLVSATKQGYTLADPEYIRRSFTYSAKTPFYVVLEDEAQRQADINAATRKVRNTLFSQLQKREEEIESLKIQKKLTEQEYQQKLQQLYDNQSKSEQLVKEMAERYVSTDYDQLDEFNRLVQLYIEEGELQKADSMIRSKGDIKQRIKDYHDVVEANNKVRMELQQSERGAAKTYEDLSQDLYLRHEIFMQEFKQDSALYCLKTRADLDTTNVKAVYDYAKLCFTQNKFDECEKYYFICFNYYSKDDDFVNIADIQNELGILYCNTHDYKNSQKHYLSALHYRKELFAQSPDVYRADLAATQNNIGILYKDLRDYTQSENYLILALKNREELFGENRNEYRADLATTQTNLGLLYYESHKYDESEKYYKLALENKEYLYKQDSTAYRKELAMIQNNIGMLYRELHIFERSELFFKLALNNYEKLFEQNNDANRSDLAMAQNNLGLLYYQIHSFINSEKFLLLALDNYEYLFHIYPDAYRQNVAMMQNNLGGLYCDTKQYDKCEKYYKLELENVEYLFKQSPDAYRINLAMIQHNIGYMYFCMNVYDKSEKYYKLTLETLEYLFNQNPEAYRSFVAMTQNDLGNVYQYTRDLVNCEKYYKLTLENFEILCKQNPQAYMPNMAIILNNCGDIYRELKDYSKSEIYYNQSIGVFEKLYNENPDVYRNSLVESYDNNSYLYAQMGNLIKAIETINKAIALDNAAAHPYDTKGEILLMQGKEKEALEMWKKVLELNPDFLKDFPNGTNLSNGLKERGLID